MKKIIILVVTIAISYCIGFILGRYEIVPTTTSTTSPYLMDYKEGYYTEQAIAGASLELLHRFFGDRRNKFWEEAVVKTKEYQRLDSALHHDWEDFYYYESPNIIVDYLENGSNIFYDKWDSHLRIL